LTMTIPMLPSLTIGLDGSWQKSTGRLECASCRCGLLGGGIAHLAWASIGQWGLRARLWACSNRPDPSSNGSSPWT